MATNPQVDTEVMRRNRVASGLSLAALAGIVGVTESAIHRWETGRRTPRVRYIPALAAALNITIDELLLREEEAA